MSPPVLANTASDEWQVRKRYRVRVRGDQTLKPSISKDALVHLGLQSAGDTAHVCREIVTDVLGKWLLRNDLEKTHRISLVFTLGEATPRRGHHPEQFYPQVSKHGRSP